MDRSPDYFTKNKQKQRQIDKALSPIWNNEARPGESFTEYKKRLGFDKRVKKPTL